MKTIIGVFDEREHAERAIEELERAGASAGDISVLTKERELHDLGDIHLEEMDVRGYGPIAASGPMTTYLTQSTAQGAPDAIVGALVQMGLPEGYARSYVEAVRRGFTLEAVAVDDAKANEALAIMREHSTDLTRERKDTRAGLEGGKDQVIPIIVEELQIGKREVGTGGVRVESHIEEVPVEEDVTLRSESVGVERRPVDREISGTDDAFRERTIEATATSEEPVVAKRAKVIEEVVIHKDVDTRTETVRDTLRKTEVDVDRFDPSKYQEHFGKSFAGEGEYGFESYAPAYRLGHEMRESPRFQAEEWSEVEPHARSAWEEKNPGTWERFKMAVRHAWERAKT